VIIVPLGIDRVISVIPDTIYEMYQVEAPLCLGHYPTVFDAYVGIPQSNILMGNT
jgi:hypothetical protein